MTRRCHSRTPEDAKQMPATAEAKATSRRRASLSQRLAGRSRKARPMPHLALALMLALAAQGVNAASSDKATSVVLAVNACSSKVS
jgi:hypothetical protein